MIFREAGSSELSLGGNAVSEKGNYVLHQLSNLSQHLAGRIAVICLGINRFILNLKKVVLEKTLASRLLVVLSFEVCCISLLLKF